MGYQSDTALDDEELLLRVKRGWRSIQDLERRFCTRTDASELRAKAKAELPPELAKLFGL